jgi:heat shock protein HtpX
MNAPLARSGLLLLALVGSTMALGQRLGPSNGFIASISLALGIIFLFMWYAELRFFPHFGVEEISGQDPWGIGPRLRELADKARLPLPRLYVIDSDGVQAMATGRTHRSGKIFLTTGLLRRLAPEEVSAVLAFEIMAIRSRMTLSFTIAGAFADVVLSFGYAIDRVINTAIGSRRGQRRWNLGTWLLAPVAAALVQLAIGRQIYLKNDLSTAQLIGNGQLLAQVLWKVQSYAETEPIAVSAATSHFYLVNPLTTNRLGRYFHAHPKVRERIRDLVGHYPI